MVNRQFFIAPIIQQTLSTQYPVEALRMALSRIKDQHVSLIHHSDRGCQYASKEYVSLLTTNDVKISMTENGDPKENAKAERINNTMKNELLRGKRFITLMKQERQLEWQ